MLLTETEVSQNPPHHRFRATFAFAIGIVVGFAWLYPVFSVPSQEFNQEYSTSALRYLRSVSILLLFPICNFRRVIGNLLSPKNFIIHFLFIVFPFLSLSIVPHVHFVLYACLPLWTAGISLLILGSLERHILEKLVFGVALSAFIFLTMGLFEYDVSESSFYGRNRSHFGFVHPIYSAGAVISSSYCLYVVTKYFLGQKSNIAQFLHLINFSISTYLLIIADSRNSLLAYALFLLTYGLSIFGKKHGWLHKGLATSILIFFLTYMSYSALTDREGATYALLNNLSSLRIDLNSKFFHSLADSASFLSLWGETEGLPTGSVVVRQNFVSYDSILVTLISNFGMVFSLLFYLWFILRGVTIIKSKRATQSAAWITFLFFTIFDAQGLTTSNTLIFFLFFMIYRGTSVGNSIQIKHLITENKISHA